MKKKVFTTAALLCCFIISMAMVADLSGKWTGVLNTPKGEFPLKYTFNFDGDKAPSGNVEISSTTIPITDSKKTDDGFTFYVDVSGVSVKHECKYYTQGDSIAVNVDYNGYEMHTTLKRDK